MSCFIVAEAGVNHNGLVDMALELVDAAHSAGADAVKFQTFHADKVVMAGAPKAEYQESATGGGDQLSMIRALELPLPAFSRLAARCKELGIEFMSTPFDIESVSYLLDLGMRRIKIPSGEITNSILLEHVARSDVPMLLSTGMASLDEVRDAITLIESIRREKGFQRPIREMLTLLHCTSNYPAAFSDLNLKAMQTMHAEFGLSIGYSDHSKGTLIPPVAVAMGATVIEKHFTLNRSLEGPDHMASLEPSELADMVRLVRDVESSMGNGVKAPAQAELPVRAIVRRSLVLVKPVHAGEQIKREDFDALRPGTGISPMNIGSVLGRKYAKDLLPMHVLNWSDVQP